MRSRRALVLAIALNLIIGVGSNEAKAQTNCFLRGDCDADFSLSVTDSITLIYYLHANAEEPACLDACDSNDDGQLDVLDALYVINYLFLQGPPPPPPFPGVNADETSDAVNCLSGQDCSQNFVRSVTQHGITWTFSQVHHVGQFVNGDYWVIGPVTIVAFDPHSVWGGTRIKNGSMINVMPGLEHGWDNTLYGPNAGNKYKRHLNVAFNVSPSNPLVVPNGSSLISTISEQEAGVRPGLKTAAVLTVLATPPPPGSFRPPYAGVRKPLYNLADANVALLASYPPVGETPGFQEVAADFERVWLEHSNIWLNSYQHPTDNMPWYGRDMAWRLGRAAVLLHIDRPRPEKELLLIRFLQVGIDLDGLRDAGLHWPALGGYMIGRKFPIMFKKAMFGENPNLGASPVQFSEDDQTFYVVQTGAGEYNYGHPNAPGFVPYGSGQNGMPEWAHQYWSVGPIGAPGHSWSSDGPLFPNSQNHRWCCTARALPGHYLAAYMMGLKEDWNHPAAFDYQDRYMRIAVGSHRRIDQWTTDMWDAYRGGFGNYAAPPGSWKPADAP